MFRPSVTDEVREEPAGRAFRPDRRPLWIAVIANGALFAVLVVFPYVRGKDRSEEERVRFARFAACFWSGEAEASPGLELPPGEQERYASNVLRGEPDWPGRCRDALIAIEPDEVFLLFPGAKQAEAQVREAVALVAAELDALAEAREAGIGAVPVRPHLAVGRLRAALAALHEVTGAEMGGEAIRLTGEQALPSPARVPLQAGADAEMRMDAEADGVRAIAIDRRGVSLVRVAAGRVDIRRVSRPGLVRATVEAPDGPVLVWAMSGERCADDEDRCAYHATGLAPYPSEGSEPPAPTWYAGHPFDAIDRSLIVRDDAVWLVAAMSEPPYAELRRFDRAREAATAPPAGEGGAAEPPPIEASASRALAAPARAGASPSANDEAATAGTEALTALLLDGETPEVLFLTRADGALELHRLDSIDGEPQTVSGIEGESGYVVACGPEGSRFVLLGSEARAQVLRIASGEVRAGEPFTLAVDPALATRGGVRLACDDARLEIVARRTDRALIHVRCDAGAACAAPSELARDVAQHDLVREGEHTLVAWTPRSSNEVHAAAVGGRASHVPAACWDTREGTGFCGAPRLAARNGRILLATREGSDLLVVETIDGGESWRPMRGIR